MPAVRLNELKLGQKAKVVEVLPSDFREKLMEMGCIEGASIRLLLKAPMGDPLAFELLDYTLSMRKKEAKTVLVRLSETNA